jgi:REP element-mobilizing transposase RayT
MAKQMSFFKDPRKKTKLWWIQKQHNYGGSLKYRKVPRPFDSKKLTHAVFKANLGPAIWFTKSQRSIRRLLSKTAARYDVKIKDSAINKDHIHLVFYTKHREDQVRFLRLFAAEMGRKYKEIRKRLGINQQRQFWVERPFTRLVSWGRKSLERVHNYLKKNRDEAAGYVPYAPRRHRLSDFLQNWQRGFDSA